MCCSSEVNASSAPFCYETLGHVALGLSIVAALVAAVATVTLFVPAVGVFILGASFTAALAFNVTIGAWVATLLLTTAAITLYCLHGKNREKTPTELLSNLPSTFEPQPVTGLFSIETEDSFVDGLKGYARAFSRSLGVFDSTLENPQESKEIVAAWRIAREYPAQLSFGKNLLEYRFEQKGYFANTLLSLQVIIYYTKYPCTAVVRIVNDPEGSAKYQQVIRDELIRLNSGLRVL